MFRLRSIPLGIALLALVFSGLGLGCRSPQQHRAVADRTAETIIDQKQQQALGRTEPLTIERPADTLRRRLMLDQNLPHVGEASLGTGDIEPIRHWPDEDYLTNRTGPQLTGPESHPDVLRLTLIDALRVGARNNREYQSRKEAIYIEALNLDLERNAFRTIFRGDIEATAVADLAPAETVAGTVTTAQGGASHLFKSGLLITSRIGVDLVRLLTQDRSSSYGVFADATFSLPLLRGAGRHIVTEPLTQAERNVIYAMWDFERFKQQYAVNVASTYLAVLQDIDQVENAEASYQRLIQSTRRTRRLADAGRLSEVQVDQSIQQELRARERWIRAQETYARRLDSLKVLLGLPADSVIELDRDELQRLGALAETILQELPPMPRDPPLPDPDAAPNDIPPGFNGDAPADPPALDRTDLPEAPVPPAAMARADQPVELVPPGTGPAGPFEIDPRHAVELALDHRLDLRIRHGQVFDAQRRVVVAADALRAGLTLTGSANAGGRRASLGAATAPDAHLRPERGIYSTGLLLDLPLERTAQRASYRISLISFERSTRSAQELEDQIKLDARNGLRNLLRARESLLIQARAIEVALRRVERDNLLLEAGRAAVRDVLEAEESLVTAQNAFIAALVDYRVGELELQRDLGLLEVDHEGLWREFVPEEPTP